MRLGQKAGSLRTWPTAGIHLHHRLAAHVLCIPHSCPLLAPTECGILLLLLTLLLLPMPQMYSFDHALVPNFW